MSGFKQLVNVADNLEPATALQLSVIGFLLGIIMTYMIIKYLKLWSWRNWKFEDTVEFEKQNQKLDQQLEI